MGTPRRAAASLARFSPDDAFLALLIAAMSASGHVSPEEGARAHNIIWSMRRFRRRSGEIVGRRIDAMRTLVEQRGGAAVIDAAARVIPRRLRATAFAVAADLILADGRLEPPERRFLHRLAQDLRLDVDAARRVLDVMLIKNRG